MLTKLQSELKRISAGDPLPYYIIHGDDDYLISHALDRLLEAFLPQSDKDFGISTHDCDVADEREIVNALQSAPLLPVRKVVVLKNFPFFQRAKTSATAKKFWDRWEADPAKAARDFCHLILAAGYSIEVMKSDEWQRLDDGEWKRILGDAIVSSRSVLTSLAKIISSEGFQAPAPPGAGTTLVNIFTATPPPQRSVIFTVTDWEKSNRLFQILSGQGVALSFEKPRREAQQKAAAGEIIKEVLHEAGKRLSPAALDAIGEKVGFETADVVSTVRKLIAYVGSKENIEAADVAKAIGRTKEEAIFELSAALSKRNVTRALTLLGEIWERGEHPQTVLSVIAREVRMLLHAKLLLTSGRLTDYGRSVAYSDFVSRVFPAIKEFSQELEEDLLGGHPYGTYLALQNSSPFTKELLLESVKRLSEMDVTLKSSPRDPRLLLERFIVGFCVEHGAPFSMSKWA